MENRRSLLKTLNNNFILLLVVISLGVLLSIMWLYQSQMILSPEDKKPLAESGVFDLSEVDFTQQKFVRLKGEVEFYWNALLTPEDLHDNVEIKAHYLNIPAPWNRQTINGETLHGKGYATYHFTIHVNSPGMYGIKIKEFETAFNMWINSEPFGGAGTVGTSRKDMTPSWQRQEFYFYVPDTTVDVVLQISNFQHRHGGASETMLFGSMNSLQEIKGMRTGLEAFLLGLLMILIMYHLILYIYRKVNKSMVYFAITSLFILFRLSTTGEKLLLGLFPFTPWCVAVRLEYISIPMTGMFLVLFVASMLPGNIPLWFKRSIMGIALTLSAFILFTPASLFTYSSYAIPIVTLYFVLGLFFFLLKAHIQQQDHSLGLFIGFILVFFVMVNDVLIYLNVIHSSYLLPFGLLFLMLSQAFVISRNMSLAFIQVEELSEKLEKHAEELEDKVMKRTQELREQTKVLDKANIKLRELDTYKKEMTRMMVHDLKNPLSNIIGLIQMPELTDNMRELVTHSGNELQALIQNILDVTKFEETELKLYPGKNFMYDLADAAYRQNKFNMSLNSIRFENLISKGLLADVDGELFVRVFSNIISNAIKFQHGNGLVRISSELIEQEGKKFYKLQVFNTGEAIPEDKLEAIFDVYNQIYAQRGEFKYSTGIGLTFCKMVVEAHGGTIGAKNEDKGVTFWFTIPVIGDR